LTWSGPAASFGPGCGTPSALHQRDEHEASARAGLIVLLTAIAAGPAWAQEPYPTRAISIVVAFPPGGLADNTARPVAVVLERLLKQPVAIINKPGAAGAVGNQSVATSKPDGYTLLMALVSVSVLPEVDKLSGARRIHARSAHRHRESERRSFHAGGPGRRAEDPHDLVDDAKKRPGRSCYVLRPVRRGAHPDGDVHQGGRIKMRHRPPRAAGP
jgi:tripartite-type tricarboxylate transporter receptor subunit TctC